MENLKAIIKELQKIKKEMGLDDLNDNTLFDKAVALFVHYNIAEERKGYNKPTYNPNEKATEKQIYFLKKQGCTADIDKLSKLEASKLIQEYKK